MASLDPDDTFFDLPAKYRLREQTYDGEKISNVKLGKHIEIIAKTGGCKTFTVNNLLRKVFGLHNIDNLIILAAELETDGVYRTLRDEWIKAGKKGLCHHSLSLLCDCDTRDQKTAGRKKDDAEPEECELLHLSDLDPDQTTVLVIDDMQGQSPKLLAKLDHWLLAGRHRGVTAILCAQNEVKFSPLLRRQLSYRIIKSAGMEEEDLGRLLRTVTSKRNVPVVMDLWRTICATGDNRNHLLIDTSGTTDPSLKFRFNFRKTKLRGLQA